MATYEIKGGEPGTRYGHLTVLGRAENSPTSKGTRWLCRCDCGREEICFAHLVRSGRKRACGECIREASSAKRAANRKPRYHTEWVHTEGDEWREQDDLPEKNGWYDIATLIPEGAMDIPDYADDRPESRARLLQVALFRDGKWVDKPSRGRFIAWRGPRRMPDWSGVHSDEGAVRLAAEVLRGISTEFMTSFEALIAAKTKIGYDDKITSYRYWNRRLSSPEVLKMAPGATQKELVTTMCSRMLVKHGILQDDADEVRKEIHLEVKLYLYTVAGFAEMTDLTRKRAEEKLAAHIAYEHIRNIMKDWGKRADVWRREGTLIEMSGRNRLDGSEEAGADHDVR